MSSRSTGDRIAGWLFAAGILTLAWIGLGVLRLGTGIDFGAGLQPSYLLMALLSLLLLLRGDVPAVLRAQGAAWRGLWTFALIATALSLLGLALAFRPGLPPEVTVGRFLKQGVQLAIMIVFAWLTVWWIVSTGDWRRLYRMLAIGVMIQFAYSLFQALHFYHPFAAMRILEGIFTSNPAILSGSEELYLGEAFTGIPRLRGTACEPLYLGNYLLLALPFLLQAATRDRRYLWPVSAALILMLGTWSRGAWLALLVAAASYLAMSLYLQGWARLRRRILIIAAAVAVLLLLIALVGGGRILLLPLSRLQQSLNSSDWSNLTRLYSMQTAWRAWQLSPIVGIGWGQFAYHFHDLVDPIGLQSQFTWPVVNNIPLMILCETGLFGLLAFGAILRRLAVDVASGLRRFRRAGLGPDDPAAGRLLAATAAVVGIWTQLLSFSQYNLPHIWVAVGLLIAATANEGQRR